MTRIRPVSILALLLLFLNSCKNDIDVNADWKETIIVYGLLDPLDSVQYVKIEKAFLDEKTSALVVAQISDSLFLDTADVVMVRTDDRANPIHLKKVYGIPKDPGIFANDQNPLWTTSVPIIEGKEYEIEVINPKSGNRVWASTKVLSPASITAPVKNVNSTFSIYSDYITVEFLPKANSYAYDVKMEFVYEEIKKSDTSNRSTKTVKWNMLTNFRVSPGIAAISRLPKLTFLQLLHAAIPYDTSVVRRVKYVNFAYYGGNQILLDYISVNQPSIGIVQKTAEYTNINGGYGIFASRCVQEFKGIKMEPSSINIIRNHPETEKLNFIP